MSESKLPKYFVEFIEKQFEQLNGRLDEIMNHHDKEVRDIRADVTGNQKDIKWAHNKINIAIGVASTLIVVAGILFASFKAVNEANVRETITQALAPYEIIIE